jgi:hypothetical protein
MFWPWIVWEIERGPRSWRKPRRKKAVPADRLCEKARLVVTAEVAEMRYKADIIAGALKLPESRIIADLLLRGADFDVSVQVANSSR